MAVLVKPLEITDEVKELAKQYSTPNSDEGIFKASRENPIIFAEKMLGVTLYTWQKIAVKRIADAVFGRTPIKRFFGLTSRQVGKSTLVQIVSLWLIVFNLKPATISNNTSVLLTSASDDQAKKFLRDIKKAIRIGDTKMSEYKDDDGSSVFGDTFFADLIDPNAENNSTTISFVAYNPEIHGEYLLKDSKSGSFIKSYPPTSIILGNTGSVIIIDEAGKNERITDLFYYEYIYPTGDSTDALRINISTAWESAGWYYSEIRSFAEGKDPDMEVFCFDIESIKEDNPKQYENVMKRIQKMLDDGRFGEVRRAYYCEFVKTELSFFDPDKVIECFTKYKPFVNYNAECDLGIDFGGQTTSRTVITISRLLENGVVQRIYDKAYDVGEDDTLWEDVIQLCHDFNVQRIIYDDCAAATYFVQKLEQWGKRELQGMVFRAEKNAKYTAFRSLINRGLLQTYPDPELQSEMLALQFEKGRKASNIHVPLGYRDDKIDSWVISAYFYLIEEEEVEMIDFYG